LGEKDALVLEARPVRVELLGRPDSEQDDCLLIGRVEAVEPIGLRVRGHLRSAPNGRQLFL
jgi:hypothetical protein